MLAILAVVGITAATALAATVSGDGTLIGTTGPDTIHAGNGDDTVWGLGGGDTITAGSGNDVIDAGGSCPKGVAAGDYPNGLPSSSYCSHGHGPGPGPRSSITAGGGDDTIYGANGPNTISVGNGNDVIYGGPVSDTITAGSGYGQGNDRIYLDYHNTTNTYTGSTVTVALGNDIVYAQNGKADTINCPRGNQTTVYADKIDKTTGCYHVVYTAPRPAVRFGSQASQVTRSAARRTGAHRATHKRTRRHTARRH